MGPSTSAAAAASGATFYDHNEVYRIELEGQGLIVRGRRAHIRCIATNGYGCDAHSRHHGVRLLPPA